MRRLPLARVLAFLACGAGGVAGQLQFQDVAAQAGVAVPGFGRGAAWCDLDLDGDLDLFALRGGEANKVFRQQADHTFAESSAAWGVAPTELNHWACVAADLDNDGDDEVFIGCGGFFGIEPNLLYRNDIPAGGGLVELGAAAGAATGTLSAVFGSTALDADLDGDLELFFCDVTGHDGLSPGLARLVRNDGGLQFTDVSAAAGLATPGNYRMCGSADWDADGWPDIGAGDFDGGNRVFRNDGDGTFTDIAPALGAGLVGKDQAFGLVFDDLDVDGDLDIYLPRYQLQVNGVSALYRRDGGQLLDDGPASGIGAHLDMGHNVFDLDNDGWQELFIGTGNPAAPGLDLLFHVWPAGPGGSLVAEDISASAGITAYGVTRTHGSAAADYDGDGDIDLFCNTGGMGAAPGSQEASVLLRNQGNANRWIEARLVGVLSNRSAVGATVSVQLDDGRVLNQHVSAGRGFGNTDAHARHFGLGPTAAVARLDVTWPSGIVQSLLAPASGTAHVVVETGLRLVGKPQIGTTPTLQACGAPAHVVDLLWGQAFGSQPMPKFGGFLQLVPPFLGPFTLLLDGTGRLSQPFPIPAEPLLVGVALGFQAWIHAPGASGGPTLGNLLAVTFE